MGRWNTEHGHISNALTLSVMAKQHSVKTLNRQTKAKFCQPPKIKEVQANAQIQHNCTTLIFSLSNLPTIPNYNFYLKK